ncbi:ubiquinol-cytochrome c reductase cytochrome b subunit [Thermodesulfobium acidiphilum]|uniref:Ubiquinol-cytochrome c reductase cytochrome b subunit n=1 Tax=Thermodesulfobium acidiphilum TaxID=1794699 RepID=A0A2R4W0U2_THEAF|nr:cytochrome b N-terminal domain-containing protein [Thermodesulfobium acidiphilum]AWB10336.1 ubiquinol-cytochrome c reductase cytochrome b subunit [Thermodesulfobium acidiphilum]
MNITKKTKNFFKENLTSDDIFPTTMPAYINSFAYIFGVVSLSSFIFLIITGVILVSFGPAWYHFSKIGAFVNSLHFWGVQIFFGGLILHLMSKFSMAAYRDGRGKTWFFGMLAFGLATFEGFTGYLSQTNWDSQWIAVQSKDLLNAMGIGGFFDPMNTAQVFGFHILVVPLVLIVLILIHLFLVRSEGPIKPL